MKPVIFTVSFVIFLTLILPVGLTFVVRNIPGDVQPPLKDTKKIYGQYIYYQSFISPRDNLVGIGVSLKNPRFVNKNYTFFNLYDDKDTIIRKVDLRGENIADGQFVKILFEPVAASLNKKFTWSISSPDSTKDDSLEVFLTDKKPIWSREFKVNNEISQDSLSYVTLHKTNSSMQVLRMVFSQFFYKMSGDVIFSGILAVLLLSLLVYLLF